MMVLRPTAFLRFSPNLFFFTETVEMADLVLRRADMSCANTYNTDTDLTHMPGCTIKVRCVKNIYIFMYIWSAVKPDRLSEGLWKLKNVCVTVRGL